MIIYIYIYIYLPSSSASRHKLEAGGSEGYDLRIRAARMIRCTRVCAFVYAMCIYIYIYICIYRERDICYNSIIH